MIHEIKSFDWPAFCQRVSQQRAGAIVNLEVIETNGSKTERVASATLQSMVFDKTAACNDVITLRLRNTREIVHEILDPIQITLQTSGESGDFNPVQIKAESGTTTITMAIHAQMLEGFKTG
ncbi:MAG: DUF5335 family protein [Verrucomicrobiota bacterium]